MTEAGKRIDAVRHEPPTATALPDRETARLQQLALRRLDQIVAAIKEETDAGRAIAQAGGGQGGGEEGGGGGGMDNGLPPLGQLKLLRAMQAEINERTEAFRRKHPDLAELDERTRAELEAIRRDQREVADLLQELTRPGDEPADGEGERP
jgi:hypothetical protein